MVNAWESACCAFDEVATHLKSHLHKMYLALADAASELLIATEPGLFEASTSTGSVTIRPDCSRGSPVCIDFGKIREGSAPPVQKFEIANHSSEIVHLPHVVIFPASAPFSLVGANAKRSKQTQKQQDKAQKIGIEASVKLSVKATTHDFGRAEAIVLFCFLSGEVMARRVGMTVFPSYRPANIQLQGAICESSSSWILQANGDGTADCFVCNSKFPASKLTEHVVGVTHAENYSVAQGGKQTWCPVCETFVPATEGAWDDHERLSNHRQYFLSRRVTRWDPTRLGVREIGFSCKVCSDFLSDWRLQLHKIRNHAFSKTHLRSSTTSFRHAREGLVRPARAGGARNRYLDLWTCNTCKVDVKVQMNKIKTFGLVTIHLSNRLHKLYAAVAASQDQIATEPELFEASVGDIHVAPQRSTYPHPFIDLGTALEGSAPRRKVFKIRNKVRANCLALRGAIVLPTSAPFSVVQLKELTKGNHIPIRRSDSGQGQGHPVCVEVLGDTRRAGIATAVVLFCFLPAGVVARRIGMTVQPLPRYRLASPEAVVPDPFAGLWPYRWPYEHAFPPPGHSLYPGRGDS
eukprot:tig00000076_g2313.t1